MLHVPVTEANDPCSRVYKESHNTSLWYFTGSQYDSITSEADPQGTCRKLPEGNPVAITPENITAVAPEFSVLTVQYYGSEFPPHHSPTELTI